MGEGSESARGVSINDLSIPRFLLFCGVYTALDGLMFSPLSALAIVAELHRSDHSAKAPAGSGVSGGTSSQPGTAGQRVYPRWSVRAMIASVRSSFKGNLSMRQSWDKLCLASGVTPGVDPASTGGSSTMQMLRTVRPLYTGFPINLSGLYLFDVVSMLSYAYLKEALEERGVSKSAAVTQAGVASGAIGICLANPYGVLFRHQVQQKCMLQPHSLGYVVRTRVFDNPSASSVRVLFRGTVPTLMTGVPTQSVGWLTYETCKPFFETNVGMGSNLASLTSGAVSGVVQTAISRPVGVVIARVQTDYEQRGFFTTMASIFRSEGIGAFFKGLLPRLMSAPLRNALYYFAYQYVIDLSTRKVDPSTRKVDPSTGKVERPLPSKSGSTSVGLASADLKSSDRPVK